METKGEKRSNTHIHNSIQYWSVRHKLMRLSRIFSMSKIEVEYKTQAQEIVAHLITLIPTLESESLIHDHTSELYKIREYI